MTETTRFTFALQFRMRDAQGALRDYCDERLVKGAGGLHEARRDHQKACEGGWVKPGYLDPEVSELRISRGGRLLPEHLAPSRLLDGRPFVDRRYEGGEA